ncbi:unnamed protein product [Durusdinium trenchii]|uniref:FACT complex subunit n=1 Tax=Durusdinium trenchii TaxID=1381693 RepID=A0ABP0S3N5_9DINO
MWPCKEWSTELEEPEVRLMLESFSRVRGQTVEAFIASSQDKTKNALNRSMEAAFNAFMQQLSEDQETLGDIAEVRSSEDHLVVLWINLPTAGIVGAAKDDFFISLITNILTKYKRNSIALVVHANRAETKEGSPGAKSEPDAAKSEVKDEDTPMKGEESDDGSDENENDKERPADSDVRDVRYQLEIPALVQQFVLGSSGGSLKLSGFPDFTGLVEAIQKGQASQVPKAYNVCVMKGFPSEVVSGGMVNISISHHTITTEDRCPTPTSKPLVFVLDDPKDPEDKKAKKPKKGKKGKEGKDALTAKNFGSRVDTSKFKQGSKLILAWRVRLDVSEGANIVPIRPIAVLSGTLDLQQTTIRLL